MHPIHSHMSSVLRNVGGNGTEPIVLVYQSKKGMKEIRNVVRKITKEGGLSLPETSNGKRCTRVLTYSHTCYTCMFYI